MIEPDQHSPKRIRNGMFFRVVDRVAIFALAVYCFFMGYGVIHYIAYRGQYVFGSEVGGFWYTSAGTYLGSLIGGLILALAGILYGRAFGTRIRADVFRLGVIIVLVLAHLV